MNGYLLDTNILIRAIRRPDAPVTDRISTHVGVDVYVSAITWTELVYGAYRSVNPERNLDITRKLLSGIPVFPFETSAGSHAGQIMAELAQRGTPIGDRDVLIAAHARSLGLTLVTHNTREFERVSGLLLEDWLGDESPA